MFELSSFPKYSKLKACWCKPYFVDLNFMLKTCCCDAIMCLKGFLFIYLQLWLWSKIYILVYRILAIYTDRSNVTNGNFFVAGKDMVSEQTLQVQKDHETWLEWTRRAPSSSFSLRTAVFPWNATPMGRFHVNKGCPHSLWRMYELFWTLVPWSSSRPNA